MEKCWLCRLLGRINPAALRLLFAAGNSADVKEAVRWEKDCGKE